MLRELLQPRLLRALVADELSPFFGRQARCPRQFCKITLHAFLHFLFVLAEQCPSLCHKSLKLFQRHGF